MEKENLTKETIEKMKFVIERASDRKILEAILVGIIKNDMANVSKRKDQLNNRYRSQRASKTLHHN